MNQYLAGLEPIIRNFQVEDIKYNDKWEVVSREKVNIYESDKVLERISAMPEYVSEKMTERLNKPESISTYDKIVLDKWGRKDAKTKKYVETPEMVFYRVALLGAEGLKQNNPELDYEKTTKMLFDKISNREIFPNTPYMANGGHRIIADDLEKKLDPSKHDKAFYEDYKNDLEQEKKIAQQLFACFVLDIYDSRKSIFETMSDAAEIQAKIGGTGFNFSNLRPANETIHGTGGTTDGPISFMSMYSHVLGKTMNQGGKREGANMFELDYNHPNIMQFIYSKRQDGEVAAANISVTTWHEFMQAATSEGEKRFYKLKNPHHNPTLRPHIDEFYTAEQLKQALEVAKLNKKAKTSLLLADNGVEVFSPWLPEGLDDEFKTIGKIKDGYVYLDAKKILKHIAFGAWFNGEPGMINLGHINDGNPTHPKYYERFLIERSENANAILEKAGINPKAENLERLVHEYVYAKDAEGRYFNLPIGVGVMVSTNPCGEKPLLGNEACVLGHTNLEAILDKDSTTKSGYKINYDRFKENILLMYDLLDNAIDQNEFTNPQIEKTQKSNRKIGIGFMGLANMLYKLEIPYNSEEGRKFVDDLLKFWEKTTEEASIAKAAKFGAFPNFYYSMHSHGPLKRNAIIRTIAPTGTTGFAAQTTGGMEPEYALAYVRTTVQGTQIELFNPVLDEKLQKYNFFFNTQDRKDLFDYIRGEGNGALAGFQIKKHLDETEINYNKRLQNLDKIKNIFVTTYDITAEDHIRMEAIVQNHVDDAVSKTTNFRNNATLDDVEKAFILANDLGIKGVTFYRDGTRKDQPLKVKGSKNTVDKNLDDVVSGDAAVGVDDFRVEPIYGSMDNPAKVPSIMPALKVTQRTTHGNLHTFIVFDPATKDKRALETFGLLGNAGSDEAADTESMGRQSSLYLRSGGKLENVKEQFIYIGSGGNPIIDRAGHITSLPMGFGVALEKYLTTIKNYKIEDIVSGNVDMQRLSNDVADVIRKGTNRKTDPERVQEGSYAPQAEYKKESETPKRNKIGGCPSCGGTLMQVEGCTKCSSPECGYTKC